MSAPENVQAAEKFGAGRGSDTEGAAARNSRPTIHEHELDELRQMCAASSDSFSAGAWCEAANNAVLIAAALASRLAAETARADAAEEKLDNPQLILDTLKIHGESFRDLETIQALLAEWRRMGGRPSLLASLRENDGEEIHAILNAAIAREDAAKETR